MLVDLENITPDLNTKGITISRIETVSKTTTAKSISVSKTDSFVSLLKEMGEDVRPKKVAKLEAYIKTGRSMTK